MTDAFAYLIYHTTRNRLASQLRRLKQPRYAIGMVFGLLYIYSFFIRRITPPAGRFPAPGVNPFLGDFAAVVAPIPLLVLFAGIWIFGGDRSALAFSEAEVAMLLPAPVPRRGLILYKLANAQLLVVLNVLIWVFLLRRGYSQQASILTMIGMWSVFTTMSLHRMGVALLRATNLERKSPRNAQLWTGLVFGIAVGAVIVTGDVQRSSPRGSADIDGFYHAVVTYLQQPVPHTLLLPFHWIVAPVFARDTSAWLSAMLPALAIVLLHVVWVLRSETAFEEAAALASEERAKMIANMRARRTGAVPTETKATSTLALNSKGNPAIAIVWKNFISLRRNFQPASLLRIALLMLLPGGAMTFATHDVGASITIIALLLALMLTLVGVMGFRSDMRSDMMHLPMLKSLPLRSSDIMMAEIISGALPLIAIQIVLLVIAGVASAFTLRPLPFDAATRVLILVAAPVPLFALDLAMFTIANGVAVLFPSWIRLGPSGPAGIEVMGQSMLGMGASVLAMAVMLIAPVLVGGGAYWVLTASKPLAVLVGGSLGAILLCAECYFLSLMLGESLTNAEPQQVT